MTQVWTISVDNVAEVARYISEHTQHTATAVIVFESGDAVGGCVELEDGRELGVGETVVVYNNLVLSAGR